MIIKLNLYQTQNAHIKTTKLNTSESVSQSVKQSILIKSNQWNSQSVSQSVRESHSQPFNEKGVIQSGQTL